MKIEFPSWCPRAVRAHLRRAIFGDRGRPGWEHAPGAERNVQLYKLLGTDPGMRLAYRSLCREWDEDADAELWVGFIQAAWSADIDVSGMRDKRRRAKDAAASIARKAAELAALIREFPSEAPAQFYGVDDLIRGAVQGRPSAETVLAVLIDGPGQADDSSDIPPAIPIPVFTDDDAPAVVDPDSECATLRYAWEKAPTVPDLLDALSDVADYFEPRKEPGSIEAAIAKRQSARKMEYLRAFIFNLTEKGFDIDESMRTAIRHTATVILGKRVADEEVMRAVGLRESGHNSGE